MNYAAFSIRFRGVIRCHIEDNTLASMEQIYLRMASVLHRPDQKLFFRADWANLIATISKSAIALAHYYIDFPTRSTDRSCTIQ